MNNFDIISLLVRGGETNEESISKFLWAGSARYFGASWGRMGNGLACIPKVCVMATKIKGQKGQISPLILQSVLYLFSICTLSNQGRDLPFLPFFMREKNKINFLPSFVSCL